MKRSTFWAAVVCSALLGLTDPAFGQSVSSITSSWTNLDFNGNVSAYSTNAVSGTGNGNKSITTPGATAPTPGTLGFLGLNGAAGENGDATPDTFNFSIQSSQGFNLNQQASVCLPTFLTGALNFFQNAAPPNANTSVGTITADVVVLDNTNTATSLHFNQVYNRNAANGNLAINDLFSYQNTTLPAT